MDTVKQIPVVCAILLRQDRIVDETLRYEGDEYIVVKLINPYLSKFKDYAHKFYTGYLETSFHYTYELYKKLVKYEIIIPNTLII